MAGVMSQSRVVTRSTLVSHNRAVVSWLVVARVCPSGLNATELTPLVWPVRVLSVVGWWGSLMSHSRAVLSWLAVRRCGGAAVRWGWIAVNPLEAVTRPRQQHPKPDPPTAAAVLSWAAPAGGGGRCARRAASPSASWSRADLRRSGIDLCLGL